jgi:hypothetical protein
VRGIISGERGWKEGRHENQNQNRGLGKQLSDRGVLLRILLLKVCFGVALSSALLTFSATSGSWPTNGSGSCSP